MNPMHSLTGRFGPTRLQDEHCPRTSLLLTCQRHSTDEKTKLREVRRPRSHNKKVAVTPATQSPASRFNAHPISSQLVRPRTLSIHNGHEVRVWGCDVSGFIRVGQQSKGDAPFLCGNQPRECLPRVRPQYVNPRGPFGLDS